MHHFSIRTANIHRAIAFYEVLGYGIEEKFTTNFTLACWLRGWGGRLELIQIPEPHDPPDCFGDRHYVGYYHLSLDVGAVTTSLPQWINQLHGKFEAKYQAQPELYQPLALALPPQQQMIGQRAYEVAFIYDSDRLPVELLRLLS